MKPNIEYIKKEMEQHKWTGSQLAMKMGVSRMEVSRFLRGKRVGGKNALVVSLRLFLMRKLKIYFFGLSGTYSFQKG